MAKSVVLPKASTVSLVKKIIRANSAVDKSIAAAEKALVSVAQKHAATEELVSQLFDVIENSDGDEDNAAPARKAPSRKAPSRKAPAKKAPAKKVPAKKAPARKGPTSKRSTGRKAEAKKPTTRGRKASSKVNDDFDDDFDV